MNYCKIKIGFLPKKRAQRTDRVIVAAIIAIVLFSSVAGITPILAEIAMVEPDTTSNTRQALIDDPVDVTGNEVIIDNNYNTNQKITNKYYIITFEGPILDSWQEQVMGLGAELFGYLPEFAFLAGLTEETKALVRDLPFIANIEPYRPESKYSPRILNEYLLRSGSEFLTLNVHIFASPDNEAKNERTCEIVIQELLGLGAEIVTRYTDEIIVNVRHDLIGKVAKINDVLWLEPSPEFQIWNNVAARIINAPSVWSNLSLNGTGQIVTVCDTGLDNGSYSNIHTDFRGRVVYGYALGRPPNDWSDANISDASGHGTHVAGSVLGNGYHSSGDYRGIAYNASLVFQSVMNAFGGISIPSNLYTGLFSDPYVYNNSRIHTNSWGGPYSAGNYTSYSVDVDKFVWDKQDQVILFAAGNIDPFIGNIKVSPPGSAKNCISVGASESLRPGIGSGYGPFCNDIDQRASFSCYGTDDKRIKPDILCPGSGILSTRTSTVTDPENHYWVKYNDYYAYAGGTSMATPLTAGAVTLIRQYYTDLESFQPSAALVKATLINGAMDMKPSGLTPPIPNYEEGWGRINIENSLFPELPGNLLYIDNSPGLSTGTNFTYTIDIVNDSVPLNITLVWSDYPTSLPATVTLVNDLHLNVTHTSSGKSYKGNVFSNGWSTSDDSKANTDWDKTSDGYDNRNNVEGIRLENPQKGRYRITIIGYNIPFGPQPFALALTGGLEPKILPPGNVQAVPVLTGNALNISWDPVFGPTINGYELYRSESPTSGFVKISDINDPDCEIYADINLIDGKKYYYKLKTKNIFGNHSNFSLVALGVPKDSTPPWATILKPTSGSIINKIITIRYLNDTDCDKIKFEYYVDSNSNGMPDDSISGSSWQEIGTDTALNGTFYWDTTLTGSGPGTQPAVILSAETYDEVPNSRLVIVNDITIDNQAPGAPILDTYSPNPTNITNITLTGAAEVDAEVQIYSNDFLLGVTYANLSSLFELDIELFEGMNNVTARACDELGNGPGVHSGIQQIIVDTIPPVADAGGNFIIKEDSWMTFNGSSSFDTNPVPEFNYISSYQWSFKHNNGTPVLLEGMETGYFFDTMGNYSITLSVRDCSQNLGTEQFWLLVQDNTRPYADAGNDIIWDEDVQLFFNASNSTDNDPEFDITGNFTWGFKDYNHSRIFDGKIVVVELFGKNVSYKFLTPGSYNITLNITDAGGNWGTDWVSVIIRDTTAPHARASTDHIIVTQGRSVTFNASESTDNDPTFSKTGNFTWHFKYIDADIVLYGKTTQFRFEKINVFTIYLTVRDKGNNSGFNRTTIRVDGDLHLPTVLWSIPADDSKNVRVTTVVKIKLSETLDVINAQVNLTTFQLLDSRYRALNGDLRYDPVDSIILFIPDEVLNFGESYSVLVLNRLVDLAGNRLDGNGNGLEDAEKDDIFKIVFSTSNITTTPYNSQLETPLDTLISVKFSGNISKFTLGNSRLTVFAEATKELVEGKIEIDFGNYSLIFKPNKELAYGRYYKINLTIMFYLVPVEQINLDFLNREQSNTPGNLTQHLDENITEKRYTWTFRTEIKEKGTDEDYITNNLILLFLSIIIVFIIILVLVFIIVTHRRRVRISAGEGPGEEYDEEDEEYDEDYEIEHKKIYGKYPIKEKGAKLRRKTKARTKGHRVKAKPRKPARARFEDTEFEEIEEYDDFFSGEDYITEFHEEDEPEVEYDYDEEDEGYLEEDEEEIEEEELEELEELEEFEDDDVGDWEE